MLPEWLAEKDVDYFAAEFERTGFRGGLNWYRNLDKLWQLTPFLAREKLYQPAVFITGEKDAAIFMYRSAFESLENSIPNLKDKVVLPGAGHWIQQERPEEVNKVVIEFLKN